MTDLSATGSVRTSARRPARRTQGGAVAAPEGALRPAEATAAGMLALFLVSLLLPLYFDIGGLRLTPIRVFLLAGILPLTFLWLTGKAGRITAGDIFFGLHCVWIVLALYMVHGAERIPFAGMTAVEIFGSYLVGRVLVRNITDYRIFFRYFLIALALLAPIVLVEMQTARLILNDLLKPLSGTLRKVMAALDEQRMGMFRAQGVLEHPILWGVFCSIAIANAFYLYRDQLAKRLALTGFATAMTFTSLSSGPLLAAGLQLGMIAWGRITRNAWWVLFGLAVLAYVAVDIVSNRSPVQVMITYMTFNVHNAWWRLHIWNYGIAEVWRNPLFGIGLNDWQRVSWMATASVDNFWLLTTMRYGIPAFLLLAAGIAANLFQIMRRNLSEVLGDVRTGHVIAAIGIMVTLCTVHIWGSTLALVMFYFGAGSWLFTGTPHAEAGPETPGPALRRAASGPPIPENLAAAPPGRSATLGSHRRSPTREERLARRRTQYSGLRP